MSHVPERREGTREASIGLIQKARKESPCSAPGPAYPTVTADPGPPLPPLPSQPCLLSPGTSSASCSSSSSMKHSARPQATWGPRTDATSITPSWLGSSWSECLPPSPVLGSPSPPCRKPAPGPLFSPGHPRPPEQSLCSSGSSSFCQTAVSPMLIKAHFLLCSPLWSERLFSPSC